MTKWLSRYFRGPTRWLRSCSDVTRWWIVFLVFFPFCVLEAVFGTTEHSSSLLSDALHTATDSASIVVMLVLAFVRMRYGRIGWMEQWSERLVVFLLAAFIVPVLWSAVHRFDHPQLANGYAVMLIATFGAGANVLQHWVRDTAPHHCKDHAHHASMSHIIVDLWFNTLVVIGGFATVLTNKPWVDPAISLVIIPLVVWELYKLYSKPTAKAAT